jgi:hypothetical protein
MPFLFSLSSTSFSSFCFRIGLIALKPFLYFNKPLYFQYASKWNLRAFSIPLSSSFVLFSTTSKQRPLNGAGDIAYQQTNIKNGLILHSQSIH